MGCVLFDFYMDESSDDKRKRYFAVGGLNTVEQQWNRFELLWFSRTHKLKKPFRSVDCECQHDQFSSWTKKDCDQLMADLVGLIDDHELGGLVWVVPIPEYAQITREKGKYDPYFFVLKCMIVQSTILAHAFGSGVRYFIEENKATVKRAKRLYEHVKGIKNWPPTQRMRNVKFSGKQLVGLQAADLIAREGFKFMDNRGTGRKIRKPVTRLERRITINCWTKEALEDYRDMGMTDRALIDILAGHTGTQPIKLKHANY